MIKVKFDSWDWKAQPNSRRINKALQEVYLEGDCPQIQMVDTGTDSYVMCISSRYLSEKEAQDFFDELDMEEAFERVWEL